MRTTLSFRTGFNQAVPPIRPHPARRTGNELNRIEHLPGRPARNELNQFKLPPHPEERREAARLEGWATGKVRVPILRDAVLRTAPQDEVSPWTRKRWRSVIRGSGQGVGTTGSRQPMPHTTCGVTSGAKGATLLSNVSFIAIISFTRPPGQPQACTTASYALDATASNLRAPPAKPPKEHRPATRVVD